MHYDNIMAFKSLTLKQFYLEKISVGHFSYLIIYVPVNNEALMFPIGILGQVWYLIVSFPYLCTLNYFDKLF